MTNDTDFTGKHVLVVGGSSGIGNGIAHGFRERGATVHVWGTRANPADYDLADGSDLSGLGYTCVDVGDPDAIEAAPLPFDTLDVLVLCQGTVVYKRGEFERPGWDRVMSVNLDSLMHISRKFKPQLLQSQGSVIIVSSISGLKANIGNPAYAASKAGAISLTKTLGQAWGPEGIRVNAVSAGPIRTLAASGIANFREMLAKGEQAAPLRRNVSIEEVGNAAAFLCSDLASGITGEILYVDGGYNIVGLAGI